MTGSSSARAPASSSSRNSSLRGAGTRISTPRSSATVPQSDAYHITAPSEDGDGAVRVMKMAIRKAGIRPDQIEYINAHGTSTPYNDRLETMAIKKCFGDHAYKMAISSTKSMTGSPAGRSRRARGRYLGPCCLQPDRAADDQSPESRSRLRSRLRAAYRARDADHVCAVELVRLRRHQRHVCCSSDSSSSRSIFDLVIFDC